MSEIGRRLKSELQREVVVEQSKNEIFIASVQVGMVFLVFLFYCLTPPMGLPDLSQMGAVGMVLMAYGFLVCIKLFLALKRSLSTVLMGILIVLDVLMPTILIWCFHLEFGDDDTLPMSTLMLAYNYYFLFLAFRALDAQVKWILVAGAASVLGWATFAYDKLLTEDMGMQIITLSVFTIVLAYAVQKSRRLLISGVVRAQTLDHLGRFISSGVIEQLSGEEGVPRPGQGVLRSAATLMVDLRGFSRFSNRSPVEEVMGFLAEYQARMVPIIMSHGGSVDKFLGDGILAHFGLRDDQRTPAYSCMKAVEALRATYEKWCQETGNEFPIGVACALGEIMYGVVGAEEKLELTAIGDSVNMVAKMEKHNKVVGAYALTTLSCFEDAKAQGWEPAHPYEILKDQTVDGMPQKIDLVKLW